MADGHLTHWYCGTIWPPNPAFLGFCGRWMEGCASLKCRRKKRVARALRGLIWASRRARISFYFCVFVGNLSIFSRKIMAYVEYPDH